VTDPDRRCGWAGTDPLNVEYHDCEWGVPVHDENHLFEMITLEGAQAGLSWMTILRKRKGYRSAFADFDPQRVAGFNEQKVDILVRDAHIVRHRGKIESTINNARRILALWEQGYSLEQLTWEAGGGKQKVNHWKSLSDIPAFTPESALLSKRLKKLGFRFVGPTTCYAFMQAAGLVNDHVTTCPRHAECQE
jgi:DNA-3-methyladenine glycosylase I